MDDNSWLIDLESALLDEECNINDIYSICYGKIIPEHLRPDIWKICLNINNDNNDTNDLIKFNLIYDLPYQNQIHLDCENIIKKLHLNNFMQNNENTTENLDTEEIAVANDYNLLLLSNIETIITYYCKKNNIDNYKCNKNYWVDILLPILTLKLNINDTYNIFDKIIKLFIPKNLYINNIINNNNNIYNLFRLLLLYHDPELCNKLDTKRILPQLYINIWLESLFATIINDLNVTILIWDMYLLQNEQYLILFLILIILINERDNIINFLDNLNNNNNDIIEYLINIPSKLDKDDVIDFCTIAKYYLIKTPLTFKHILYNKIFNDNLYNLNDNDIDFFNDENDFIDKDIINKNAIDVISNNNNNNPTNNNILSQKLCLPVNINELFNTNNLNIKFFLIDCRPYNEYNSGHLIQGYNLDRNLMLQEPIEFSISIQGLLLIQKKIIDKNSTNNMNNSGEHLCFMDSGNKDDEQYTNMIISSFLQKKTQYVSILQGGYKKIHEYFGENIDNVLEDHNSSTCIECYNKNSSNNHDNNNKKMLPSTSQSSRQYIQKQQSSDLFSKLSSVMKIKSAEVKDKLYDYIVNPTTSTAGSSGAGTSGTGNNLPSGSNYILEKHVSSNEKNDGKRYRNIQPVFSIDDDVNDDFNQMDNDNVYNDNFTEDNNLNEIVNIHKYLKNSEVINHFKCHEVQLNGYMYDSYLIITNNHLIVLRDLQNNNEAKIIVKRLLSSIVKITAKKRHRDLITFKYGFSDKDKLVVTDMDRFLIPDASNVTTIVSKQIVKFISVDK